MNYKFSNLLGAPYRGGNLLIHENELISSVGNKVSQVGVSTSSLWPPGACITAADRPPAGYKLLL
jgi:hypothetical protein